MFVKYQCVTLPLDVVTDNVWLPTSVSVSPDGLEVLIATFPSVRKPVYTACVQDPTAATAGAPTTLAVYVKHLSAIPLAPTEATVPSQECAIVPLLPADGWGICAMSPCVISLVKMVVFALDQMNAIVTTLALLAKSVRKMRTNA